MRHLSFATHAPVNGRTPLGQLTNRTPGVAKPSPRAKQLAPPTTPEVTATAKKDERVRRAAFAQLDAAFRDEYAKDDADGVAFRTKFALTLSRDDFDERDFEVIDWRNSAEGEAQAADRDRSLRWPPEEV